ncbi:MAG: hypothetical protein IBJ03_18085 [Gemmatimonadaceae bacterium]|nr:hypothetical protein [Gemmatimonadaceae bacterium]
MASMNSLLRRSTARSLGAAIVLASVSLVASSSAQAQGATRIDDRFQPWIGCWETLGVPQNSSTSSEQSAPSRACILPSSRVPGSVDLVMLSGSRELSRTALPLPGQATEKSVDECKGSERAEWLANDTRLLLRAELTCDRGIRRVETGLMSIASTGEWLQLQTIQVDKSTATTVARFRFAGDSGAPGDLGALRSSRTQRLAAGAPLTLGQVLDVSVQAPPALTEAWIAEMGLRFDLDAKRLVALADGGMPSNVIDLLVALANPEAFTLRPNSAMTAAGQQAGTAIAEVPRDIQQSRCGAFNEFCYGPGGMGAWGFGYGFSRAAYGMWDPFDPWGWRYSPYGSSLRYGMGGMGAWNPWGWPLYGQGPIIIVNQPPVNPGQGGGGVGVAPRGRAVNGLGYTRGSVPSGGSGEPRPAYYPPGGSGASGSPAGGGSTGGGSSAGSSGGGGGGGRTAKPRGGL